MRRCVIVCVSIALALPVTRAQPPAAVGRDEGRLRVLLPNGSPAAEADAHVIVGDAKKQAWFSNGILQSVPMASEHSASVVQFRCDQNGDGSFPTPREPFVVLVMHECGWQLTTAKELQASAAVTLAHWGRIEGIYRIGREPAANATIRTVVSLRGADAALVTLSRDMVTDAKGRFTIDRVVPRKNVMIGVVDPQTALYKRQTVIAVVAGDTAQIQIGGIGRPVLGRALSAGSDTEQLDWRVPYLSSSLRPTPPTMPADVLDVGAEARKQWAEQMLKSDAYKAWRRLPNPIVVQVEANGRFRIEDVPAGRYTLSLQAGEHVSTGAIIAYRATREIVVPAVPNGYSDEPFDVEVLRLEPVLPMAHEFAPDFDVESIAAGRVKLAEFRGKWVLLDFWATWCGPCVKQMPALKQLNDKYRDHPQFALISLSLDKRIAHAREHVETHRLDWNHGFLGQNNAPWMDRYGVPTIPALFLIAPDGRFALRRATLESVAEMLRKELGR